MSPGVLDGIRLSDTVLRVRHPLHRKELQSSFLQVLLGDAQKSSASESRSISTSAPSIIIVLIAGRATLKQTRTTYDVPQKKRISILLIFLRLSVTSVGFSFPINYIRSTDCGNCFEAVIFDV